MNPRTKVAMHRSPALLEMARGRHCLLRVPMVCSDDTSTVVAAHSNEGQHGKGKGLKAEDHYSVWACARCHTWYDSSMNATRAERESFFRLALDRQKIAWTTIANSQREFRRYREAASAALARHGVKVFQQQEPRS